MEFIFIAAGGSLETAFQWNDYKKKFLHPRREERCRRIKHTMRKLDAKISLRLSEKKLHLRSGSNDEGTEGVLEGTVAFN